MSPLEISRADGWVKLTLNRPDRLNSLNEELKGALLGALRSAASDDAIRAVLLTGAGRGFCAGQDLGERQNMPAPPSFAQSLEAFYNPVAELIRGMEKPVVCAVNGVAAGAGANLALSCDIVLAAHSARFIQAFSNIGLVPDTGGTWLLPRLIGDARARALILLGEPISAELAAEWGMIWRSVPDEDLVAEAEALARSLAERPTQSLAASKALLNTAFQQDLATQLRAEAAAQDMMGGTQDYREGVAAFTQKRRPSFTGR